MQDTLIGFMNDYSYIAVLLLILAETVFPPIPSEVILLFGGFMTTYSQTNLFGVAVCATIGSVLGAVFLYWLGCIYDTVKIKKFLSGRWGKILRLKPESIDKTNAWFHKFQYPAVLICRCIPIVRSLISIPAGMSGMRLLPFLGLTLVGSAVWNMVLVSIGAALGSAWEDALGYFGLYTKIAAAALVLIAAILFIVLFIRHKKKAN